MVTIAALRTLTPDRGDWHRGLEAWCPEAALKGHPKGENKNAGVAEGLLEIRQTDSNTKVWERAREELDPRAAELTEQETGEWVHVLEVRSQKGSCDQACGGFLDKRKVQGIRLVCKSSSNEVHTGFFSK